MSYLVHILSDINFQELKRYVFIVFLKQFVVIAHLRSFGKLYNCTLGYFRDTKIKFFLKIKIWI